MRQRETQTEKDRERETETESNRERNISGSGSRLAGRSRHTSGRWGIGERESKITLTGELWPSTELSF